MIPASPHKAIVIIEEKCPTIQRTPEALLNLKLALLKEEEAISKELEAIAKEIQKRLKAKSSSSPSSLLISIKQS